MKILHKSLIHLVAIAVFAAISSLMFYPELQDKAMHQGDVMNYEGTTKDLADHLEAGNEHPGWLGRMFGGMPATLSSMDHGVRITSIFGLNSAESSISMMFWAMVGFYLMLMLMGVSPYVAIGAALGYGLSTYFPIIIGAGHITKMWALQWVAPLVGSVWYSFSRNMWIGGALTAFFTALIVASGHHQITYYFLFVILSAIIGRLVIARREGMLRHFYRVCAVLFGAAILGVGSNIVAVYNIADYSTYSTRGDGGELGRAQITTADIDTKGGLDRDYINAWSYGKAESFNMFIPNFMGGGRDFKEGGEVQEALKPFNVPNDYYKNFSSYHGSQPFTEGPVYIGAVLIFLAIFALFLLPGTYKWWIIAPSLLALMLSWGSNFSAFTDLFIDYMPLYNKFRVPSMILVILEWSVPLLAGLGLCKLYKMRDGLPITYTPKHSPIAALKTTLYITGGFALFSALILPSMMNFSASSDTAMELPRELIQAMRSERASLLRMDALRSLLYVVATAAVLWLYIKGSIKTVAMYGAAIAVLVTLDLFTIDRRYIDSRDFSAKNAAKNVQMTDTDRTILQDTENYRVADFWRGNPFAQNQTTYFHRSIGGYHPAKLGRYQDIIDQHLSKMNLKVYDMLNVRYLIDQQGEIQLNPKAIGNATIIDTIIWAQNPTQELELLNSPEFDPQNTAIVDIRWEKELENATLGKHDSTDFATLETHTLGYEKYTAKLQKTKLIAFSEIYYKDWKATINGKNVTPIQINYTLRGIVAPAGKSEIVWTYKTPHQKTLKAIATTSTILIILWTITAIILTNRKKLKNAKKSI